MQTEPERSPSIESAHEGSLRGEARRAGEFFSKLSASSLEDFSAMEYPRSYAANVVLFSEKDPVRALFVILDGAVRLSINSIHGRRLSLRPSSVIRPCASMPPSSLSSVFASASATARPCGFVPLREPSRFS